MEQCRSVWKASQLPGIGNIHGAPNDDQQSWSCWNRMNWPLLVNAFHLTNQVPCRNCRQRKGSLAGSGARKTSTLPGTILDASFRLQRKLRQSSRKPWRRYFNIWFCGEVLHEPDRTGRCQNSWVPNGIRFNLLEHRIFFGCAFYRLLAVCGNPEDRAEGQIEPNIDDPKPRINF